MVDVMESYRMRLRVEDACRALQSLDGELAKITLTPGDAASVEAAMRQMEAGSTARSRGFAATCLSTPM